MYCELPLGMLGPITTEYSYELEKESCAACSCVIRYIKCMHAMYIASYGYFLNLRYIHDDIIMDVIVGLNNLEGCAVG